MRQKSFLDEGDCKELSPAGLTSDYTELRQKVGFTYACVCESFEALTRHPTISDTTSTQMLSKQHTQTEQSVCIDNHIPDPLSYLIFISEAR